MASVIDVAAGKSGAQNLTLPESADDSALPSYAASLDNLLEHPCTQS